MQDLKYRGPLSFRGLRFFALLAMTGSQFSSLLLGLRQLALYAGPQVAEGLMGRGTVILLTILKSLGGITFPLLLIASMSIVIRKREKIYRVMLSNFLLAAVTYIFIVFFAEKIVQSMIAAVPNILPKIPNLDQTAITVLGSLIGQYTGGDVIGALQARGLPIELLSPVLSSVLGETVSAENLAVIFGGQDGSAHLAELIVRGLPVILDSIGLTSDQAMAAVSEFLTQSLVRSHLNVNVFLDLFLCTVFYYFVAYRPKRLTGGKLLLFRCCGVLPICYLVFGSVLMGMNRADFVQMSLPLWLVGMLPSRKIPGILLFLVMVIYVKYHEAEEYARGGDERSFSRFLHTNRNSLRFSLFMCAALAILSLADWGAGLIANGALSSWGLGVSTTMYLAIPFVLLFSYNRVPRFKVLNAFVPVYYALHYFLLIMFIFALIYAAPQLLQGVALESVDFSLLGN